MARRYTDLAPPWGEQFRGAFSFSFIGDGC
jgi:hypothetical protein